MVGQHGIVRRELTPEGQIFVNGELWRARLASDITSLPAGTGVVVDAVEGLLLHVHPDGAAAAAGTKVTTAPRESLRRR